VERGETEVERLPSTTNDEYQSDCSETDMVAAKAFKRAPQSTTSQDNMMTRVIDDSDGEE
jgi:hypothetical protein